MTKRVRLKDRVRQIFDFMETVPEGKTVVQDDICNGLGMGTGQWVQMRDWLNLIVFIQNQPTLEREFIPVGKNRKKVVTRYHLIREDDSLPDNL